MTPFYRFAKTLLYWIGKICGTTYLGKENLPQNEAVIYVANHTSYCDPIILACMADEQVHFLAKSEFAEKPVLKKLFSALGVVFLKRDEADLNALKTAINILKANKSVAMFPEGKRNLDLVATEFKQGAAFIAYRTQAKLVPMAIINSRNFFIFWKRDTKIIAGEPILIEKGELKTSQVLDNYTKQLEDTIKGLIEANTDDNSRKKQLP